jgi:hypothetical protein
MIAEKMKATVAIVFAIVLLTSTAVADKPKTVDEAVQVLKTKWLQPKDLDWILRNTRSEVTNSLYMGFGTGVRTNLDSGETISRFTTRAARETRRAVLS